MTTQHTPSAGAMRAAEAILRYEGSNLPEYIISGRLKWAELIDRETAAPELLEACKAFIDQPVGGTGTETVTYPLKEWSVLIDRIDAAITKAENLNAK